MLEQEEKENSKKANRYRKVKRLSQLARLAVLFLMATSISFPSTAQPTVHPGCRLTAGIPVSISALINRYE